MQMDTVIEIFTSELKGTQEGQLITLPHGTKVTIFLAAPAGVLPVTKVDRIQVGEKVVILYSDEGRVFIGREEVVAVRADQEADTRKEIKLGFS